MLEGVFRVPYILGFCTACYGYPGLMGKWSQADHIQRPCAWSPDFLQRERESKREGEWRSVVIPLAP